MSTDHGPVWVERQVYPAAHAHGRYALGDVAGLPVEVLSLLGTPDLGARPAFLDTETTGLAGGAGTLVFLTGIGVWEDAGLILHLIFLRSPEEEPAALHYIAEVLDGATGLVTFNGRGFDVPLLETRFILNRLAPRWLLLPHLDLLGVARQLWREHLPSRRLGVLEEEILEITRTEADVPSWMIPDLYRQYLLDGDTGEMARIFYHNRIDVLSLVSLLAHTARMIASPEQMALSAAEWVGIGRVYDRARREAEAMAAWERALAGEAGEISPECAERVCQELGLRYKRREAWTEAFAVWEMWARSAPWAIDPFVERAKYYEWTAGDLEAALKETQAALRRAASLPRGMQQLHTLAELRHRQERLERKLAGRREEDTATQQSGERASGGEGGEDAIGVSHA